MRGYHWNAWEKYLAEEDSGRVRSHRCWKAWGDVLPFESITEMISQESKCWRAWEQFLSATGAKTGIEFNQLDVADTSEKVPA
jgi:hypothetical protein